MGFGPIVAIFFLLRELSAKYDNALPFRRKVKMHLRWFVGLSVVGLCFLTTDTLFARVGESPQRQDRSGPMTGLKSLQICVEDIEGDKNAGIIKSDLEAQTLVTLKRNIPALTIRETASCIGIFVVVVEAETVGGQPLGYSVMLRLMLLRPVNILADDWKSVVGVARIAGVWERSALVTGTRDSIARQVKDAVDSYLTQFSADYYKQN